MKWTARAHPSRSAYNAGCRCDECRAANAKWVNEWNHRTGRTDPARDMRQFPSPHGSPNRYQKYKCRCDLCRAANTERMRRYKARLRGESLPARPTAATVSPQT